MNLESLDLLFDGRNSLIYLQKDTAHDTPVVIKVLKENFPSIEQITQFNNEYELTKDLQLEGLRKAFERRKIGEQHALVLQYFDGEPIRQVFDGNTRSLAEFLDVAIRIADALAGLHQNHIIHKDINPANILINANTHAIKIIDFGLSSRVSLKASHTGHPARLEGTLAYISPEQTGRVNRVVDHSTDLYSLGVTFYEMLTGRLPFDTSDPLELVHCHIARKPVPLCELDPEIPSILSDIIDRLLAKTAENRYLSAHGLRSDLQRCLASLQTTGRVSHFAPGQHDVSSRFQISPRLYGREREIQTLLETFDRLSRNGTVEFVLVSGYSGVGKTSLVNEIHKPIVERRGHFISGKYAQFQRDIPYSALVQAFSAFVDQLLTESTDQLARWKARILAAVGSNARVLIDVIPTLELVLDEQPAVPALGITETENRFNHVFGQFFRAIARPEHPLVLFIDDLQWADLASLQLLSLLVTDEETTSAMIIGAYRDNEVDASHPFILAVKKLENDGARVDTIHLSSLAVDHVNALVSDTLHLTPQETTELAELVHDKTGGNAFFAGQFLTSLYQEELLAFDHDQNRWSWNIAEIRTKNITDNVVELMASKIEKLSHDTRKVLEYAACIGNRFSLHALALIDERKQSETLARLWEAIAEGLVVPLDDNHRLVSASEERQGKMEKSWFKFLHDRVEQACYWLIPLDTRKQLHCWIGRAMRQDMEHGDDHRLFDVVNQLNRSTDLLDDPAERLQLAELNLAAGLEARSSTAYVPARGYLAAGMHLLPDDAWDIHYELTRDLHRERILIEYLTGDFAESQRLADLTLANVKSDIEKAETYNRLVIQHSMAGHYEKALELVAKGLGLLTGIPARADLAPSIASQRRAIRKALSERTIASLANERQMTDPVNTVSMDLLAAACAPAYLTDQELLMWVGVRMVNLTLEHGLCTEAAQGLGLYGTLLAGVWEDYRGAYEFGTLALQLAEQAGPTHLCKVSHSLASNILSWTRPIRESYPIYDRGHQAGLDSGEWQYAGYMLFYKLAMPFYQGELLSRINADLPHYLHFVQKTQNQVASDCIVGLGLLLCNLMGQTADRSSFDVRGSSEKEYLESSLERHSFYGLCPYHVIKSQILYWYGQYHEALRCDQEAEKYIKFVTGKIPKARRTFQRSLILLALYPDASEDNKADYLSQVIANQEQLKIWADHCEANFLHQYLLVEAERVRLVGGAGPGGADPIDLYDRAIALAGEHGFMHDLATANARAGSYWLERGKEDFARLHLRRARYLFATWGATRVAEHMDATYGSIWLRAVAAPTVSRASTSNSLVSTDAGDALDISSILKAAQVLSQEVRLDALLENMLAILTESAGADHSVVIQNLDDHLVVQAMRDEQSGENVLLQARPLETSPEIPLSVINFVKRRKIPLVINDVENDDHFAADPSLVARRPRAVLCFPVMVQDELRCILYFENRLSKDTFTSERLELLRMLSAQIAISLENAHLYENLERKVVERTSQLEAAQEQIVALEKEATERRMAGGFAHEMRNALSAAKMALAVAFRDGTSLPSRSHEQLVALLEDGGDRPDLQRARIAEHAQTFDKDIIRLDRALTIVRDSTNRALEVTDQILDYSRLGYASAGSEPVSARKVIETILEESQARTRHANIRIEMTCDGDGVIESDESHLYSIFKNIIDNAHDALTEVDDDRERIIEIALSQDSDELTIEIRDSGVGVSDEDQDKLFEPFFSRKPATGTGLGLSFVSKLLSIYHGRIAMRSPSGGGALFRVTLPNASRRARADPAVTGRDRTPGAVGRHVVEPVQQPDSATSTSRENPK